MLHCWRWYCQACDHCNSGANFPKCAMCENTRSEAGRDGEKVARTSYAIFCICWSLVKSLQHFYFALLFFDGLPSVFYYLLWPWTNNTSMCLPISPYSHTNIKARTTVSSCNFSSTHLLLSGFERQLPWSSSSLEYVSGQRASWEAPGVIRHQEQVGQDEWAPLPPSPLSLLPPQLPLPHLLPPPALLLHITSLPVFLETLHLFSYSDYTATLSQFVYTTQSIDL